MSNPYLARIQPVRKFVRTNYPRLEYFPNGTAMDITYKAEQFCPMLKSVRVGTYQQYMVVYLEPNFWGKLFRPFWRRAARKAMYSVVNRRTGIGCVVVVAK